MNEAVMAKEGYDAMLAALLDGLELTFHLYTNDPTLSETTAKADLTEATHAGYKAVTAYGWTPPALSGEQSFSSADVITFTATSPSSAAPIRGYFVTVGPSGPLAWAWRATGDPFTFSTATPNLFIEPTLRWPLLCS